MEEGEDEASHKHGGAAVRHIKKRSLRNKSLSIAFDDKDLRDYITGFHKRKKKRRKQAEMQLQEKERLKRIEGRKKRKLEKEIALYGGCLPAENQVIGSGECTGGQEEDEDNIPTTSISGTKIYERGETTITVTTSELPCEDEDIQRAECVIPHWSKAAKDNPLGVNKKAPKRKGPLKKMTKRLQRKQKAKRRA